jgi:type II secretory pathway component PulC
MSIALRSFSNLLFPLLFLAVITKAGLLSFSHLFGPLEPTFEPVATTSSSMGIGTKEYQSAQAFGVQTTTTPSSLPTPTADAKPLKQFLLKGIYTKGNNGFIIIALQSDPMASEVIAINEFYRGFKLTAITKESATFIQNNQTYKVTLAMPSKIATERYFVTEPSQETTPAVRSPWKSVQFKEINQQGTITGFKVSMIEPNAPLRAIGLQEGDTIISIDGSTIQTYADIFTLYKSSLTLNDTRVVVSRDGVRYTLVNRETI